MSNPVAISAVTAALRNLFTTEFAGEADLADLQLSTQPPDKARTGKTNQLNVFLYRTSPNAAWINQPMPHVHEGETGQPPLTLDLHYLFTAYGRDDAVTAVRVS